LAAAEQRAQPAAEKAALRLVLRLGVAQLVFQVDDARLGGVQGLVGDDGVLDQDIGRVWIARQGLPDPWRRSGPGSGH
jgi:hypothetical protein